MIANLFKPRNLPPPDPRCRTYDFAQTAELFRNFEQYSTFPSPASANSADLSHRLCGGGRGFYDQAGVDPAYYTQHTYEQLSRGF